MSNDFLNPAARKPEVPLSFALLMAGGFALFFYWLKAPHETELMMLRINHFGRLNLMPLSIAAASLVFNVLWIGTLAQRYFKKVAQRSQGLKTGQPIQEKPKLPSWKMALVFNVGGAVLAWLLAQRFVAVKLGLLPFAITASAWIQGLALCLFLSTVGLGIILSRAGTWVPIAAMSLPWTHRLPKAPQIQDGIILGAINEPGLSGDPAPEPGKNPTWICQGLKGMTGNIFMTAAIGWGKSQVLLRLVKQCLANFTEKPALLAIDPKRTFVRELRRIIQSLGMGDRLMWVSLDAGVRFNPIWREGMLKESVFTAIANSLRLASMNFIGSSSDSRFWEQSSFNLLKASLIYCAVKYDYFTFKDLYRALVDARDGKIVEELVNALNPNDGGRKWDAEERGNIEMATNYFRSEFMQMDEKIRTSILATATSFLNEFLEYRVSRVLSPERADINLPSMSWAIAEGKMILIHIENDALARSIGTLLKLLYQEAVLARVRGPEIELTRHTLLVMDEYQDVATSGGGAGLGDDRFLAMARESKAITIAATQSVSSLENAIRSVPATAEILQNFRTRLFGNTTDPKTIRLFQEPHGQVERERSSHSFSESAQNARHDAIFGGYDSGKSSVSEGVSTHTTQEYPVTAREFARLRAFEAHVQVFDGLETQFEKLFLKPHFLPDIRTPHRKVLEALKTSAKVGTAPKRSIWRLVRAAISTFALILVCSGELRAGVLFPNVCSVLKTGEFSSCLDFQVGACMCGFPPRPCAQISYYVPQTFLEVWPNANDSFFKQHPAAFQLALHTGSLPFGAEDDNATFSFHAHAIAVPLTTATFAELPCQGARIDKPCFDLMSEDLGSNWKEGKADSFQPSFLAWQLSPKTCILKGAAEGLIGANGPPSPGFDSGGCSFPLPLPKYPPSPREACNGWGVFFPRYGVYHGASRAGAALMVAARLKSLGSELSHTVPTDTDEIWQMLYPQSSSCFKEGQTLGLLETLKGVREEQRMLGKLTGYLFVVWKRVSCCHDIAEAPAAYIAIQALRLACQAIPDGGL